MSFTLRSRRSKSRSAAPSRGRKLLAGFALAAAAASGGTAEAQTALPPPPDVTPASGWTEAVHQPGAQYCGPQADVHPVSRKYIEPHGYLPRANLLAATGRSLSGAYGSLEYLHLRISDANAIVGNSNILGSPQFNPLVGNRTLNTIVFGDPSVVNITPNGDPSQIVVPGVSAGRLDLTEPIFISPGPLLSEISSVDILAANPFFVPGTNPAGGTLPTARPLESPNALLFVPNTIGEDFENVPGIRGMVGYRWTSGIALEASVFGTSSESADFGLVLDGNLATPDIIESDPSFDLTPLDNFDDDGGTPDNLDPNNGGVPVGVFPNDQRRRRLAFIPINVTDTIVGFDETGREVAGTRTVPLFYDQGLDASYKTNLIGSDAQVFVPVNNSNRRLSFDLSLGGRYLNVDERMSVSAIQDQEFFTLRNAGGTVPTAAEVEADPDLLAFRFGFNPVGTPRTTMINSDVDNHVYAAQIGFRSELDLAPFTIGVAPKFGLGANNYSSSVTTANLFRAPDPNLLEDADALTFKRSNDGGRLSASLDLNVYANVQLREWLRLNVGYNLMVIDGIQRAPTAVDYTAAFTDPAFGVKKDDSRILVDGLSVGFEVLLP